MRYLLLLVCALALAPSVGAQPATAYYGVALGSFEYEESDFGQSLFADTSSSYRLMVGYLFNEHFAVEGGWGKTGTLRDSTTFVDSSGSFTVDFRSEFKILTVRAVGMLPFDNGITLLGGIGYADMGLKFSYDVVGFGVQSFDVDDGTPTYFGGVQYDWDRVAVRLAYEKYSDIEDGVSMAETSLSFFYKL